MVSRRAWEAYPATYREREVEILANWVRMGESGSVVGSAGAGKSNLLGFLCARPEVITRRFVSPHPLALALVLVDLNGLPSSDLSTFYRVIMRSLYEARAWLAAAEPSLPPAVEALYRKAEAQTDPFVSQSALREALLAFRERDIRLVLALDPFDAFCRAAPTQVLDTLRGLRDSFKGTLSYLVGLRRELVYLRDPAELGELYELLDTHVCWLGPMERQDARWVIAQVEGGMGRPFEGQQVERLIDLAGGYPSLLRAASLWLAHAAPVPEIGAWEDRLLAESSVRNRLREIWLGLTGEEQAVLAALGDAQVHAGLADRRDRIEEIEQEHGRILARLQARRLCVADKAGWHVFSPLFARFAASTRGAQSGGIYHETEADRFYRGQTELAELSAQDRRLLCQFMAHAAALQTIDDLIDAAWAEYDSSGVSNAAVQQAIRHLRTQIEPDPSHPRYLITERGRGYRFFPEGAPGR